MAYDEKLADRVREALVAQKKVEEKKMFRDITFMVNGKMCVSIGNDEILCRIDPVRHETVLERNDCREMIHSGRVMRGFLYVHADGIKTKKDFDFWIHLALDFNKKAKASAKPKKKS